MKIENCFNCQAKGEPKIEKKSNGNYYVRCSRCGLQGKGAHKIEDAIEKWNEKKFRF